MSLYKMWFSFCQSLGSSWTGRGHAESQWTSSEYQMIIIMIKGNAKILPATWLDWKMWPRYFFEANNDRVLAAAFDFLKSDGTDRHLGNCTANLYMQFNLKVHLSYFFVIHILRSCGISSFLSSFVLSLLAKMTAIPTRKLCSYCLLLTLILMLPFYELKYRI